MVAHSPEKELVQLLSELVAIDSVNPAFEGSAGGEAGVASLVADFVRRLGLEPRRQPVLQGRDNVLVELSVTGARDALLFESHMDTVALAPMGPRGLKPEVRDGRLYGRGACDDKGSLAAMMVALKTLVERRRELKVNVLFLAAVDEEVGFSGISEFINSKVTVHGAVVGEPTSLRPVIAHKGVVRWRVSTLGRAAHGSQPENGVNAIDHMALVLRALQQYQVSLQSRRHPLVGSASINVGRIWGGIGANIVPDRCTIEIDRRLVPGEEPLSARAEVHSLLAELSKRDPAFRFELEEPFLVAPTLETPDDAAVVSAVRTACRESGVNDDPTGVPYASDAGPLWSFGSIPAVVLGPGSIDQAHTADEYVPIDELCRAVDIYVGTALCWGAEGRPS